MTPITYENVAKQLVQRVPEFSGVYQEHLKECDQTLPHVMFGDLVEFTIAAYRALDKPNPRFRNAHATLMAIVDFIEDAAHSEDKKVIDLLLTSFMENLNLQDADHKSVSMLLLPASQKLLKTSQT